MSAAVWAFAAAVVAVVVPAAVKLFTSARGLRNPSVLEDRLANLQGLNVTTQQALDQCLAENRQMKDKVFWEGVGHAIAERQLAAANDELERLRALLDRRGDDDG